jgi:23S rRNA (adenine2503-C2)-methyltransferase
MSVPDLASMTFDQLQDWFTKQGKSAYRGRQVFRWLQARGARSFGEMTDISKALRAQLDESVPIRSAEIVEELGAEDGTLKFRFRLHDGLEIEGVYMPEERRRTLCVSTQVGCAMGCAFCATGTMGLVRSLSAGEITGQVGAVATRLTTEKLARPVTNVVFMGMGEPLANLGAVATAVQNLLDPHGMGLSRRHVTVSTVGLVPAMEEFAMRVPVKLAVSLNATTDEVRSRIMPVNKRYNIKELLDCCRHLPLQYNDRLTFEYVMLGGVNDSDEDAHRLARLLSGIRCKVNLIPFNPFGSLPFSRPDEGRVESFQQILIEKDFTTFVRRSRGDGLRAACGQLVAQPKTGED